MRLVYVCSPYRGDVNANVARAVALCRAIALEGDAPLAPHMFLPRALRDDDPAEREIGRSAALAWLDVCDEICVAPGPVSEGMRAEIEFARERCIPFRRPVVDGPANDAGVPGREDGRLG